MRKLFGRCLLVGAIACAASAQHDSGEISEARVYLGVNTRGDLSVHIYAEDQETVHTVATIALVPFTAPICYMIAVCPLFFRRAAKA